MPLNYYETAAALRAEIERLEREHGASRAYVATFRLLKALELLAEAGRLSIRLASKAAWDKAAAMPTLSTRQAADCFPLEIVTPSEARCSLDEAGAYRVVMRGDWRNDKDFLSLILTLLRSFGYAVPHVWMIEEAENERAEKPLTECSK